MGDSKILIDTLAYSSIFSSPLTEDELYYFLHTNKILKRKEFKKLLDQSADKLSIEKGYIVLKGKESFLPERIKGSIRYEEKITLAKRAAFFLSFLPTIYFIGLTGSVAAGNPGEDDIDLLIITGENALFTTRFLAMLILSVLKMRRRRGEKNVKNKVCLNMFCDLSGIGIFSQRKNIYVAREITQMVPLMERQGTYKDFLEKNNWIKKFTAHAGLRHKPLIIKRKSVLENVFMLFEPICSYFSRRIMSRHQKNVSKNSHFLFFYPLTMQKNILRIYKIAGGLL